jgi:glycosyltransferase involved in cell wall biosynthesis
VDGFVVPFRDPAAISDRLERLYRSAELRRRMGEAARRRALEFTWERYGDEVVRILDGRLAAWKARGESGTR